MMLRWLVDLKIAINNLKATRTRTALTITGIVIGVASVTVVLALAEGAKNMVRDQINRLGEEVITVRPGKTTRDSMGNILNYNFLAALSSSTLTERDLLTTAQTEGVKAAAPLMMVTGSIGNGQKMAQGGAIIATNGDCAKVLGMTMRVGDFLPDSDNRKSVILGRDLAVELTGADTSIGQRIYLRGQEFVVAGIISRYDASASVTNLFDFNRAAFINLDAGKGFNQGIAQIQQINARVATADATKAVANNLQQKLLVNHGNEEDFTVLRPEETLQLTDSIFRLLTGFATAVASISILVGGIGIMNIMLVSVTERTREIGIRKAVGATNQQILSQFLIEALVMTTVGGLLGIAVGYALAFVAGTFLGFMPGISVLILLVALTIAIGVGILFGAWPAIKAARKDPIEALRYFQ